MKKFFRGKRVLITGASSGIGQAFVRLLAAEGATCVIVARRRDRLEKLSEELRVQGQPLPEILCCDLLETKGFDSVRSAIAGVDVLINNAGMGMNGRFLAADQRQLNRMYRLNFEVPLLFCQEAAATMTTKGRGWILNVASIAGLIPTPFHGAYSASKAGVVMFSESLHGELMKEGISVTCLCPGVTDTEFFDAGGYETKSLVYKLPRKSPESVAAAGLSALAKNKIRIIPGFQTQFLALVSRLLPISPLAALSGWAMSTD